MKYFQKLPEFVSEKPQDRVGFLHAFIASLSVIVVSELGDKTFFIAAIMAMKHPRLTVFIGAITALTLMTILSGIITMEQYSIISEAITGLLRVKNASQFLGSLSNIVDTKLMFQ